MRLTKSHKEPNTTDQISLLKELTKNWKPTQQDKKEEDLQQPTKAVIPDKEKVRESQLRENTLISERNSCCQSQ